MKTKCKDFPENLKKVLRREQDQDVTGDKILKAINELPEMQRLLVLYKFRDGFSYDEICDLLGGTPPAMRAMLGFAIGSTRKLLSLDKPKVKEKPKKLEEDDKYPKCEKCHWLNRSDKDIGYCFILSCKEKGK